MKTSSYHHGDLKNALIQAGVQVLAGKGVNGLSLREVAKRAGVSHSAPYAHFADKQALIAAIATEGHTHIHDVITTIFEQYPDDPLQQLIETGCAYLRFGLDEPDLFKITFSGVVEQEHNHPDLVKITKENFFLIRQLVSRCQAASIFAPGPEDLIAQNLWGSVYGLVTLLQQGQISSTVLDHYSPRQILLFTLDLMTQINISLEE
jgi:AcrR family transcriptional regulator